MTKQEWLDDVIARIPEDAAVKCWSIFTETEEAYHIAIGEEANGAEMIQMVWHTLDHVAKSMKKTPIQVAKVAIALAEAKEAFEKDTEREAADDDE